MKTTFMMVAACLAVLPGSTGGGGSAAASYSPAALARAKALVGQSAPVVGVCTQEELTRRVNACINSRCAALGPAGGVPFYSCISSCVTQAEASCRS